MLHLTAGDVNGSRLRGAALPGRLTESGRDVREALRDAIDARGIDRWLGGVHLVSPPAPERRPVWRWHGEARRMERDR